MPWKAVALAFGLSSAACSDPMDLPSFDTDTVAPSIAYDTYRSDAPNECDARLTWWSIEKGQEHVPVQQALEVGFNPPLPTDEPLKVLLNGEAVSLHRSDDGQRATVLTQAMAADTEHRLTVRFCNQEKERRFTTLGSPVDLADLDDRTWVLSFAQAQWVSPATPPTYAPSLSTLELVLEAETQGDALHLEASFRPDGEACETESELSTGEFPDNPVFETLPLQGDRPSWLHDLQLQGIVYDEGERLAQVELFALIDLQTLLGYPVNLDPLARRAGANLIPCGTGSKCLPVVVTLPDAYALPSDAETCTD